MFYTNKSLRPRLNTNTLRAWGLICLVALLFLTELSPIHSVYADGAQPVAITLRLDGALIPIWQEMIQRAVSTAQQQHASVVILQLDTPGGSIDLMEKLVQQIRSSPVPIVVYIFPSGAMAGSAGTMITLAGHAAAMAPETTIGAASPVGSQGEDIGQTEQTKVKEILKAMVRTLTSQRGTKASDLAQQMIETAQAASAKEALDVGLIDAIASNVPDLLTQLDGHKVMVQQKEVVLKTAGARTIEIPKTLIEQLLTLLTDPNLVFLLLTIGVQALLIELSSPGGWVAGFVGAVSVLLGVYGLGLLPVNWFGGIFMLIAFVLFLLDIKAPTHGALTLAGVGSFILGALVLFNSPTVPSFERVSVPLVVGSGITLGIIFFSVVVFALRAQQTPVKMGVATLNGQVGVTRSELNPTGSVQVGAELWTAELEDGGTLPRGSAVEIIRTEGVRIIVRKVDNS
jgi:membrane-bound serine protease (ClpP class)